MPSENNPSNIALTITFTDPELTAAERNENVSKLLKDLQARSEIEAVERVRDPHPQEGNKAGWFHKRRAKSSPI